MSLSVNLLVAILTVGLWTTAGAAERADPNESPDEVALHVIDLEILSTNQIMVGTNAFSLVAATNLMAAHRGALDVVAVHGPTTEAAPGAQQASALERIASLGIPLVIVEKEGEYAWREQPSAGGIRTVQVGTDQFAALSRFLRQRQTNLQAVPETSLQTTVKWDTTTGTYKLSRVELGLLGKRVWLMHEQSGDEAGTIGIQIKKEW